MPRGQRSTVGEERDSPNGYTYIRTRDDGWQLKHKVLMEEHLGRKLGPGERIRFKDGDRQNITVDNLEVYKVRGKSARSRIAVLEARIAELQAELDDLQASAQ